MADSAQKKDTVLVSIHEAILTCLEAFLDTV